MRSEKQIRDKIKEMQVIKNNLSKQYRLEEATEWAEKIWTLKWVLLEKDDV